MRHLSASLETPASAWANKASTCGILCHLTLSHARDRERGGQRREGGEGEGEREMGWEQHVCVHAQVEKRREGALAHPYFLGFQWLATAWAEPGRVLLSKLEKNTQIKALQVPAMSSPCRPLNPCVADWTPVCVGGVCVYAYASCTRLHVYMCIYIYLSIYRSIYLSIYLSPSLHRYRYRYTDICA